jgi:hypothetical protein
MGKVTTLHRTTSRTLATIAAASFCTVGVAVPAAQAAAMRPMHCPEVGQVSTSFGSKQPYFIAAPVPVFRSGPYGPKGGDMGVSFQAGATVGASVTGTAKSEINGLIAKAEASVSVSLSASVTASTTLSATYHVSPGMIGNAQPGSDGYRIPWKTTEIVAPCTVKTMASGTLTAPSHSIRIQYWETRS